MICLGVTLRPIRSSQTPCQGQRLHLPEALWPGEMDSYRRGKRPMAGKDVPARQMILRSDYPGESANFLPGYSRGRGPFPGRIAGLHRIIQGQHIDTDGRHHKAEHQPGAPIFVQPRPQEFVKPVLLFLWFMRVMVCVHEQYATILCWREIALD